MSKVIVSYVQVQQAPKHRRRTYRAHGRIGPYTGSPCHIKVVLSEKPTRVPKESSEKKLRTSKKGLSETQVARTPKGPSTSVARRSKTPR
jgi:large subunit ribosomal protein L17e